MRNKVDYFISRQVAPTEEACILVAGNARYVPAILSSLARYLEAAAWISPADASRGYQETANWMEALLACRLDELINNIIALRDPSLVTVARNPTTGVPITDPARSSILDVGNVIDVMRQADLQFYQADNALQTRIAVAVEKGLIDTDNAALLIKLLALI